jgi:hypothetical protein
MTHEELEARKEELAKEWKDIEDELKELNQKAESSRLNVEEQERKNILEEKLEKRLAEYSELMQESVDQLLNLVRGKKGGKNT